MATPFSARVGEGLKRSGKTLRELCRAVELDPSFFSKVLAGKRSPPTDEAVLRRIARELQLDEAGLVVAAGRIPAEWRAVCDDPGLFAQVHRLASGRPRAASAPASAVPVSPSPRPAAKPQTLSEELL